ncbi:unnamed protein product [Clonostachys rosea f. rosea IK726]|uniref:Uncharacterized protein n=1 Tax=Clonostachys rosea f. rosea IK726 TaxID=1349383 RepID=A0ACA9U859_BIOOC|nr:unnamed protein product [Clonostachys rosea f. rosea IK726]
MSPSDERLTQSFYDEPELRVAPIPREESYNSSLEHGKSTDVAPQELSNSSREDIDAGGTAAKRPWNPLLWANITYDEQRNKFLWIVPKGNTYDLLMGVLQSQGGTATTSDGTALDHVKLSLGIKSEDEIEDEGIKNEKSEDEGIKNEKSEDEGLWDQTLQWVRIAYDEQSKTYLFIVPEENLHYLLMIELRSQGGSTGNLLIESSSSLDSPPVDDSFDSETTTAIGEEDSAVSMTVSQ